MVFIFITESSIHSHAWRVVYFLQLDLYITTYILHIDTGVNCTFVLVVLLLYTGLWHLPYVLA